MRIRALFYAVSNSLVTATNQTLGVEDRVARVHSGLILGGIADETLLG